MNPKHPPSPPMDLANMRRQGVHHSIGARQFPPRDRSVDALSRALIGWFELASFDFCLSQHSIGTRKAQVPYAFLIAYFLRAQLVLLRFRQIFPCFWCHCSLIHSPMDPAQRPFLDGGKTATREALS